MARPITDADYDQVRQLHADGLSRNAIAKQLRRSGHTISRLAVELGLSFDRGADPHLREITETRKADGRARRAALAEALLADAEKLRQQLFAAANVHNFGGKDNTFEQAVIDQPTFRDQRDIMHAIGLAVDRALKIDAYDRIDESGSAVDAWIAAMTGS